MLNQTSTRIRRWYARSIAYRLYSYTYTQHHCLLHPIMLLHKPEQVFANAVSGSTSVSVQKKLYIYIYVNIYICIFSILCAWQACHMWVLTDLQLSFWGVGLLELDLNWGESALTSQDLHVYTWSEGTTLLTCKRRVWKLDLCKDDDVIFQYFSYMIERYWKEIVFKSFQLHTCDLPQISYCHYALLVCHTTGASSMTSLRSSSCLCTANLVSKVEASYVRHCGSCSFCAACQSYSCCLYFVGPFPGWESASRQISVFCACTVDLVLLCVLLLTARINMIQNLLCFDVPFWCSIWRWTKLDSFCLTEFDLLQSSGAPCVWSSRVLCRKELSKFHLAHNPMPLRLHSLWSNALRAMLCFFILFKGTTPWNIRKEYGMPN